MKLPQDGFDDSRARRLFPDQDEGYLFGPSEYQPIIDSLGSVLVQVDDNDYQGDTRVLLQKDGRYGFLNFGWGSCSGCDALQACSSYREIELLIQGLEADIKWFDSKQEAIDYIASKEREASYYFHSSEWRQFVERCSALAEPPAAAQSTGVDIDAIHHKRGAVRGSEGA